MEMEFAAAQNRKRNRLKKRLRPLIVKALLRFFSWMPLGLAHMTGGLLGRLMGITQNDIRYTAGINTRLCLPQWSEAEHQQLLKRYLIETGKTALEMGAMWLWSRKRILSKVKLVTGEEHLHAAYEDGHGVILAIPHLGAWEMVGLYCSSRYPMTSLYRPPKVPGVDAIIRRGRERFGAQLVPTDNHGVKALFRALSRGETIGILPDQEPGKGQGEFAPFFGIPAYSMTLLSRLAQKTGATVVFAYAERLPFGRGYHLHFLKAPAEIADKELATSVAAVNSGVESCIQQCPVQYQWGYRRFKSRPGDERGFY